MKLKMKPETIERRHREFIAAKAAQHRSLIDRLTAKAAEDPTSIYAEMLAEVSK